MDFLSEALNDFESGSLLLVTILQFALYDGNEIFTCLRTLHQAFPCQFIALKKFFLERMQWMEYLIIV
jgi:hypothetical protein